MTFFRLIALPEEVSHGKDFECAKVDPSSGCKHVVGGETEEEVLQKAAEHAKEHGNMTS